jgi:hypothetical protein
MSGVHPMALSAIETGKLKGFSLYDLDRAWKILDTHFGSGSSGIACHDLGFDLTASEIDRDYYGAAMERIREYQRQQTFNFTEAAT